MGAHLVTGVSGFIGATLARRLLDDGFEVRGVDRDPPPPELMSKPEFEFFAADLALALPDGLFRNVDVLYHLAASTGVSPEGGPGFAQ